MPSRRRPARPVRRCRRCGRVRVHDRVPRHLRHPDRRRLRTPGVVHRRRRRRFASQLGATHPLWIGDDERFGRRSPPCPRSTRPSRSGTSRTPTATTSTTPSRRHEPLGPVGPRRRGRSGASMLDRAADLISERSVLDGAALAWENGKSRLEAIGEVEEAADLIRYYTHAMREHDGFAVPMERFSEAEVTSDVMRPYGVWAVIAPFNYPSALVGRAGRRRARRRQHRDHQAVRGRVADRAPRVPGAGRRRGAARRRQHRHRRRRRRARRSCITRASTASRSPARARSACRSSSHSRRPTRSRRSARWAARTR